MTAPFIEIDEILKKNARTFYLSLRLFPAKSRKKISLAFLLCKIADALVDSDLFSREERGKVLLDFIFVLSAIYPPEPFLERVSSLKGNTREKELVLTLNAAIQALSEVSPSDKTQILEQVRLVSAGMQMDLFVFHRRPEKPESLQYYPLLDDYCFKVAGSAGAFLTRAFYESGEGILDPEKMIPLGVDLGKGLQLINILRDREEDAGRGRFYLESNAAASDLKPVFVQTLYFLERGLRYVSSIPRRSWRVRLASIWPILFGLKTLRLYVRQWKPGLDKKVRLSRGEIYRTVFISLFLIFSNRAVLWYTHGIRNNITAHPLFQ